MEMPWFALGLIEAIGVQALFAKSCRSEAEMFLEFPMKLTNT